MKDYIIKRPMLLCAIICCVISFVGFYAPELLLLLGIAQATAVGFLLFKRSRPQTVFCIIVSIVMTLSMFNSLAKTQQLESLDGTNCKAELVLCETTYKCEEYYGADVEVINSDKLPKGIKLYAFYNPLDIASGEIFSADVKISKIDEEYRVSNYSEGIYLNANLSGIAVDNGKNDTVLHYVDKVRTYIKNTTFSNMGYNESATVCALVFGDRSYFTDRFYGNIKSAGVMHVMVVSGMHLSILVALVCGWLERFVYNRFVKAFTVAMVVLLLIALCGFTMSMLRAGITYWLMSLSLLLNRKSTPENTLGAAVVIILIASPFAIHNLALQLSFLSTFGILVIALPAVDFVKETRIIKNKALLSMFSVVTISLSALITTLPVVIYKLGYVSTVSIITNLLISSAVTLIIWLCCIGFILNLFTPVVAQPILKLGEILTAYVNSVISFFGKLPFSSVCVSKFLAIPAVILIAVIIKYLLACNVRHNMIKLNLINQKIIDEGGKKLKWQ